jgi:hypothetical protein
MKIISWKEAKALGLKRYFTGKPCKHGHICERTVINRHCKECLRWHQRRWETAHREIWLLNNIDRVRQKSREYERKKAAAFQAVKQLGIEF